jgi:alginate O-acetyltransferase complex protein AlgI
VLFCSQAYLVFFLSVFALYWATPWQRLRVWLLLAASFYFYSCWSPWLAVLVFASSAVDFFLAGRIAAARSERWRKGLVALSVTANLGLLCYFKYANFFLDSLGRALRAAGAEISLPTLSVLLPIGISFYTFEAINYIVDVYRRKVPPERNLAHFLLFILFFPHLVAGPIVRARDFLPQIRRRKRFSWLRARVGVQLLLLGLVKKLVIADRMAMFVDPVFADPLHYQSAAAWTSLFAYALQLYGDFSGYSDMALGSAHLLGYHLSVNFNMPYLSRNVTEFWQRWHISLSTWLRDYLFFPLGGSRGGRWMTSRNIFLTMTLAGLWHGATWNWVLWGMLNGLMLIGHRSFAEFCPRLPRLKAALDAAAGQVLRVAACLSCLFLSFVLVRTQTLGEAAAYYARLFAANPPGKHEPMPMSGFVLVVALVLLGHALGHRQAWQRWFAPRLPAPVLGGAYALALAASLLLAPPTGKPFIYFQF